MEEEIKEATDKTIWDSPKDNQKILSSDDLEESEERVKYAYIYIEREADIHICIEREREKERKMKC